MKIKELSMQEVQLVAGGGITEYINFSHGVALAAGIVLGYGIHNAFKSQGNATTVVVKNMPYELKNCHCILFCKCSGSTNCVERCCDGDKTTCSDHGCSDC